MKTNAIARIIIWSLVIVLLLGIMGSVMFGTGRSYSRIYNHVPAQTEIPVLLETTFPAEEVSGYDGKDTFSASEVREIEIEWVAGDILIQPHDTDTIEVREDGLSDERYAMLLHCRDGELKIQFCDEDISLRFGVGMGTEITKDLTIYVPRDWVCESLELDVASASVEVNDMTIREVDFDGASGTCEFENCSVNEFDIDTASGDIRFIGSLDMLDCDAASASVYAVLSNTPSRMDMDTMSGDLDITLPENAGFAVSMNAMSSNFSSDFETTMKNGNHVCGDGRCRINVDALSGDVILRKGEPSFVQATIPAETTPVHVHSELCQTDPNSCPDTHQHSDTCTTDPNSCPNTHQHTNDCITNPTSCPTHTSSEHHSTSSSSTATGSTHHSENSKHH